MTVLQGSAAMPLMCGGMCTNNHFVENFVLSLAVEVFLKVD